MTALLSLIQWLSPAFPTGGYAYSHGLEQAVVDGSLTDAPSLRHWLEDILTHGSGRQDAILLACALRPDADQLDTAAALADEFSAGETRVTHDQNLLLPWVRAEDLPALWVAASHAGLARSNVRLLTDMIACPGGDFCALANARSIPIAAQITERYQDMDELHDLGEIDLHISGCINSCGHHHSGHIGILGVDKDGQEWYQVTLGGSDGTRLSGEAVPGKVIGPSFAANEMVDVIEALLTTYRAERQTAETFTQTVKRVGIDPFKTAANAVRVATARTPVAA